MRTAYIRLSHYLDAVEVVTRIDATADAKVIVSSDAHRV